MNRGFLERHRTAIVIGAVFVLGGGCAAGIAAMENKDHPPHTTTAATPTETPDHKFVRDMDNAFDAEMNPGKNPVTDIWTYRTFKDDIAATGHDICQYLGSHNYDETAQQFKLKLPLAYPSDSDAREFVNIAIDDLCPQYTSMEPSGASAPPSATPSSSQPQPAPHIGNPNCGSTPSSYQCNEQGYLQKLASDNIAVHDAVAVVNAGYAVCAITGPADIPPSASGNDLVADEQAAAVEVAGSGAVASGDAKQVVTDAIMFLC